MSNQNENRGKMSESTAELGKILLQSALFYLALVYWSSTDGPEGALYFLAACYVAAK